MATWKKVLVSGLDLNSSGDITNNHIGVTDGTNSTDVTLGNNITFAASGDLSVSESSGTITYSFSAGATANSFSTINAPNGTDPVATSSSDTLNLTNGNGITITGNSGTDTIDIKVPDGGIDTLQLAAGAVETAKITDSNVTYAKIQDVGSLKVLGNVLGSAATVAEITIDTDFTDGVSNTHNTIGSAKAIKDYIDAQNTAADLDFQGDTGGALSIDLDSQTLSIVGTTNEIETAGSGTTITIGLPNDVTIGNDLTVTGDLTVSGTTTTLDTTNLLVEDTFISLNNGGASNVDAGIVFEGAANKVFGWDQSQESGRFGVDYAGGDASATGGGFSPDGWVSVTHTNSAAPTDVTNGDIDALRQIGNIYVNSTNQDIYIYS